MGIFELVKWKRPRSLFKRKLDEEKTGLVEVVSEKGEGYI